MTSTTKDKTTSQSLFGEFLVCCNNIPPDFNKSHKILEQLLKIGSDQYKKIAKSFLSSKPLNEPSENYTSVIKNLCDNYRNAFALTCVAKWYLHGLGVDKNPEEAARLLTLAANQGFASAYYNLGWCYEHGFGVDVDQKEAVRLYKLAADKGNSHAQNNLGWCYERGFGVDKDLKEAVRLYKIAANQENAIAQYNLGRCNDNVIDVDVDLTGNV